MMYSVDRVGVEAAEDGSEVKVATPTFFQVFHVVHAHARMHLIHTVRSADDITQTSGVALNVQLLDPWHPEGTVAIPGTQLVYPEGQPEWLAPSRLAAFADFVRESARL